MPVTIHHDSLLKNLFKAFFADLIQLAIPTLAPELALERVTWLDKELFADLFAGRRAEVDLLAEVPTLRAPPPAVLIQVEIERRYRRSMSLRMHRYYLQLQLKHSLTVLSLVVFLQGGPPGAYLGESRHELAGFEIHRFHYHAFGLSGCRAEAYVAREEPLAWALAALMPSALWSRPRQKVECLRSIAGSTLDEARQALLVNVVETYLQLEAHEEDEYMSLLELEPNVKIKDMELTWADRMEAKGVARGARQVVLALLADRFGTLSSRTVGQVEAIDDADQLLDLSRRLLRAGSLAELGLA